MLNNTTEKGGNNPMKYSKGDLLLDSHGDLYKVLSVDSELNRYDIGGFLAPWIDSLDAEVLEQSYTKLPAGTVGELVDKLLDYPVDTLVSIYRTSGPVDLYLDSFDEVVVDYKETGGIVIC